MSGNAPEDPSTPVPPEVPDEFAEAYRVAYERALAAQSDVAPHRSAAAYDGRDHQDPDRLPRRVAPLRVGTHRPRTVDASDSGPRSPKAPVHRAERRQEARPGRGPASLLPQPSPQIEDELDEPTAYERVRDSRWFVPVLLVLLAVLLVVGAYAVGRAFSGSVGEAVGSPDTHTVTARAAS